MNKKVLLFLFFCLSSLTIIAQANRLHGTWESHDTESPVQMILDQRGFITFKANGQLYGGVGYNVNGEKLRMTYRTHQDSKKIKITITVRDLIKKEILKRDTGTIVFKNSNNIKVCFKKTVEDSKNSVTDDCRQFLKIM